VPDKAAFTGDTRLTPSRGWRRHVFLARIDAELDELIVQTADRLNVTKTTFIADASREAIIWLTTSGPRS